VIPIAEYLCTTIQKLINYLWSLRRGKKEPLTSLFLKSYEENIRAVEPDWRIRLAADERKILHEEEAQKDHTKTN